ncbi:tyrosine-type recombinase/integrase [Pseudorhodoplanes sp.]|uniref:tyrosine-type recombinase/integrase n=1 Tax=Pseudorhodoplanes sp. TaxID=1934341 RepID=UPI003D0F91AD
MLTFEPRGIARAIRDATQRQEFRVRTPQGGMLDKLVLEVMGDGRCTWRVIYTVRHGRIRVRRKAKIGDHRSDLATVRQRWRALLVRIDAGDPVAEDRAECEREAASQQMTFAHLLEDYENAKAKAGLRSIPEIRRILQKDAVPDLGHKPVIDITALDIERILERISERGSPAAARAFHVAISGTFSWALGVARWRATGLSDNVATQITKAAPPRPRTRKLSNGELRSFWWALDQHHGLAPGTADAARLCLLLARRTDEVLGAAWSEFDMHGSSSVWRIPLTRTKSKREIVIPLPALALRILDKRRARNATEQRPSAFVFKGAHRDRDQPLNEGALRTALRRIIASGVVTGEPFSPHDLRRTCAHRAAEELDFDRETIQALLGHVSGSVTDAHYTQASKLNRIRRLLDEWADYLMRIVADDSEKTENVMAMRRVAE